MRIGVEIEEPRISHPRWIEYALPGDLAEGLTGRSLDGEAGYQEVAIAIPVVATHRAHSRALIEEGEMSAGLRM